MLSSSLDHNYGQREKCVGRAIIVEERTILAQSTQYRRTSGCRGCR